MSKTRTMLPRFTRHAVLVLCVSAVVFAAGCELLPWKHADSRTITTPEFTLREGDTVELESYDASFTFVRKTAESRCPEHLRCFWAGEAKILVRLAAPGRDPASFELTISGSASASTEYGHPSLDTLGFQLKLLELNPYPSRETDGRRIRSTATIRIEPLSP